MSYEEMERKMREIAKEKGVVCTEYLPKIAKARETMKIGLDVCPCDAKATNRGCISERCLSEILNNGICHCRAFRRKE